MIGSSHTLLVYFSRDEGAEPVKDGKFDWFSTLLKERSPHDFYIKIDWITKSIVDSY